MTCDRDIDCVLAAGHYGPHAYANQETAEAAATFTSEDRSRMRLENRIRALEAQLSADAKPSRRFEVTIRVSGDTWDGTLAEIDRLAEHVRDHGSKCDQVSGGYSTGSWVQITERPEMTHDRFVADLDAYLAARKASV